MTSVREELESRAQEFGSDCVRFDGLDDAIVGSVIDPALHGSDVLRVIYSEDKIIKVLMERDEMSLDDAREFYQYNIERLYLGQLTPIIMNHVCQRGKDGQQGWFTDDDEED